MNELIPLEVIENKIFIIRRQKVMLDSDLAALYGVTVKRLNEQVKRNTKRFPSDFMFQLNEKELENLRSQIATTSWGGRRYTPYVFTEQGVAMLTHKEFARKSNQLEKNNTKHAKQIYTIFEAIKRLMEVPEKKKRKIGFNR